MFRSSKMEGRKGGEKPSNFSLTCSLLSQYLKEKGSLGDLVLEIPPRHLERGQPEPPKTMNLLSGIEDAGTVSLPSSRVPPNSSTPLTIFYGGKVMVFEDFPADKAKQVMAMASRDQQALSHRASYTGPPLSETKPLEASRSPDLPIARRCSLHRFLEKRKDRIIAKAPYPPQASKEEDSRTRLGRKPLA